MDVLEDLGCDPAKIIIDHNNEETVRDGARPRQYWAAFTIYPHTKLGNERMVEIMREYGSERIIVDSSADWGISDPLAVPNTAALMKERGISLEAIEQVCLPQPARRLWPERSGPKATGRAAKSIHGLFDGNTLLRGGQNVAEAMNQYMIIK